MEETIRFITSIDVSDCICKVYICNICWYYSDDWDSIQFNNQWKEIINIVIVGIKIH